MVRELRGWRGSFAGGLGGFEFARAAFVGRNQRLCGENSSLSCHGLRIKREARSPRGEKRHGYGRCRSFVDGKRSFGRGPGSFGGRERSFGRGPGSVGGREPGLGRGGGSFGGREPGLGRGPGSFVAANEASGVVYVYESGVDLLERIVAMLTKLIDP
jgi:hypothetical protein